MQGLGLEVLLKGKNLARILGGLDAALKISMISIAISIPLGTVSYTHLTLPTKLEV